MNNYRHSLRLPYMIGVYLGINAFRDVYLVVDGPDCLFFKAEFIQGSHDLCSSLLRADGYHKVAHTEANVVNVISDREPEITALIRRVALHEPARMVLVTAMPMAAITGVQYDRLAREISAETGKPVIEVPGKSLSADWYEGYQAVLEAVATGIPLETGKRDGEVAVVGMLFDRNESDRMADVSEISRLLSEGVGARVSCIWPSGMPLTKLAQVANAEVIVSLPAGRKAARVLANRTGARLVEADLPFGLEASARFVRAVAATFGAEDRAERFIKNEYEFCKEALHVAQNHGIRGKRLVFVGEPGEAVHFRQVCQELGAEVAAVLPTNYPATTIEGVEGFEALTPDLSADLWVTNTRGAALASMFKHPFLEHGFPSYATHSLAPKPHLGFKGMLQFAQSLVNTLNLTDKVYPYIFERVPSKFDH